MSRNFSTFFKLASRPGYLRAAYFTVRLVIVNNYFNCFSAALLFPDSPLRLSRKSGVFYSPFSHCQQLFRTVFSPLYSFKFAVTAPPKEWRILQPAQSLSTTISNCFFRRFTLSNSPLRLPRKSGALYVDLSFRQLNFERNFRCIPHRRNIP